MLKEAIELFGKPTGDKPIDGVRETQKMEDPRNADCLAQTNLKFNPPNDIDVTQFRRNLLTGMLEQIGTTERISRGQINDWREIISKWLPRPEGNILVKTIGKPVIIWQADNGK